MTADRDQATPATTVPDNAGLREELERLIHAGIVAQWHGSMREDVALTDPRPIVRDLLSGPLAALLAERDKAVAQVAAVRGLAAELWTTPIAGHRGQDYRQGCIDSLSYASDRIRRALGAPS